MPFPHEVAVARGRVAGLTRSLRNKERFDETALEEARQHLRAVTATARIERIIAEAPPFTDEQRTKLAELLAPVRVTPGGDE